MKPFLWRSAERSRRCLSRPACTWEEATTARSSLASSEASSAPFPTRWPSSNGIFSILPAISGRIITASSARRLPTAPVSITAFAVFAATALTGIAGAGLVPWPFESSMKKIIENARKAAAIRTPHSTASGQPGPRPFCREALAGFRGVDHETHVRAAPGFLDGIFHREFESNFSFFDFDDLDLDHDL